MGVKTILFFGDSLTAGYGLKDQTQSVPGLIQQKIDKASRNYEVINGGQSGDTSSGGLARLDYWISRPIDVFVLELGINDLFRKVALPVTFGNLDRILNRVITKYPQAKLALMGMTPPPSFPISAPPAFKAGYEQLAATYQMAYVPFYLENVAGDPALNLWDQIHPNARGYEIIAAQIWPVINSLLS